MNGTQEKAAGAQATEPSPREFLKKHVRGIPREKMKERKVYFGFRYKDLKDFINSLIGQYKDLKNPELLSRISELELKLDTLRKQKSALEKSLVEAEARPKREELEDLETNLSAAEEEKAALEARLKELEASLSGTADEHAKRAQDLSAELTALKETFEKLEKESEFLDEEVEKLDGSNKELTERNQALKNELDALREEMEVKHTAFDKERGDLDEKVQQLEKIVATSRDSQKLLELQKEYATYKDILKAYETAASEAVDIEDRPDPEEVAGWSRSVRERLPEDAKAAHMVAMLENLYNTNEGMIQDRLDTMYEGNGSFRVILDLGKALIRAQHLADGIRMLDQVTSG